MFQDGTGGFTEGSDLMSKISLLFDSCWKVCWYAL